MDISIGITYAGATPAGSPSVTWEGSNPEVIQFRSATSSHALLEALQPGNSTISASLNGKSASMTITVRPPGAVQRIVITNSNLSALSVGTRTLLFATAVDSEGVGVPGAPTYTSSDPGIVAVSNDGALLSMAEGSATITASKGGTSATAAVNVLAPKHAFFWTPAEGMRDLGVPPGYSSSTATAVSATGSVAGNLYVPFSSDGTRAFRWSAAGGMVVLELPNLARNSEATGINSSGEVVGFVTLSGDLRRAAVWSPAGEVQLLGVAPGDSASQATGINDNGDIVGWTGFLDGRKRSFLAEAATGRSLITINPGIAYAVNSHGLTVGILDSASPYAWEHQSSYRALTLLPGDYAGVVLAVSNSGDMLGLSGNTGCEYYPAFGGECDRVPASGRPVLWSSTGTATNLLVQPGLAGRSASVTSVNSARQVVGSIDPGHAFIWSAGSGVTDLGVLPRRAMSSATAINDAGQVAGWSGNP
jgi:uncharacterized membrane protein